MTMRKVKFTSRLPSRPWGLIDLSGRHSLSTCICRLMTSSKPIYWASSPTGTCCYNDKEHAHKKFYSITSSSLRNKLLIGAFFALLVKPQNEITTLHWLLSVVTANLKRNLFPPNCMLRHNRWTAVCSLLVIYYAFCSYIKYPGWAYLHGQGHPFELHWFVSICFVFHVFGEVQYLCLICQIK